MDDLHDVLSENITLKRIIPICASCKRIRNDEGVWEQVEESVDEHSEALFSHGICPDCMKELYSDYLSEK